MPPPACLTLKTDSQLFFYMNENITMEIHYLKLIICIRGRGRKAEFSLWAKLNLLTF